MVMNDYNVDVPPKLLYPEVIRFSDGSVVSGTLDFSKCSADKHNLAAMLVSRMLSIGADCMMKPEEHKSDSLYAKLKRILRRE